MTLDLPSSRAAERSGFEMVETHEDLEQVCRQMVCAPCIGLDTEFERTRTFFARLALLQLDDGQRTFLIDPLSVNGLAPLTALLGEFDAPVIMHAPSEDLSILARDLGRLPRNLFDTQLAAALCGRGWGIGYDRLVQQLFEVEISKAATRSDWMQRPLSPAQRTYAAADVHHLPAAHDLLEHELDNLGRREWLTEEIGHLVRRVQEPEARRDFGKLARKLGGPGPGVSRLYALCQWRESRARERDLPRRRVMEDALLVRCAQNPPASVAAMQTLARELGQRATLSATELFQAIEDTSGCAAVADPYELEDLRPHRKRLKVMKAAVSKVAGDLAIAEELLAPRRLIEQALVATLRDEAVPAELQGWRAGVILDPLMEASA